MNEAMCLIQRYINIDSKCLKIKDRIKNLNYKSTQADLQRILSGTQSIKDLIYSELTVQISNLSIPDIENIITRLKREIATFETIGLRSVNIDELSYYNYIARQNYIKELEKEISNRAVLDIN